MSISDSLESAKSALSDFKRNMAFKKANKDRQAAVQLQSDLAKCRGKLEICEKEFSRTIRTQSANIRAGQREGMDTLLQEQILWDAAVGYMLVRDAVYAIKTITNYDSVEHAYEMLEQATAQMANKPGTTLKNKLIGSKKERDEYGYITSSNAQKEKERMLEMFFDKLKITGDIEACIAEMNRSSSGQRPIVDTPSSIDDNMRRLREMSGTKEEPVFSMPPEGLYDFSSPSDKE